MDDLPFAIMARNGEPVGGALSQPLSGFGHAAPTLGVGVAAAAPVSELAPDEERDESALAAVDDELDDELADEAPPAPAELDEQEAWPAESEGCEVMASFFICLITAVALYACCETIAN